MVMVAIELNSKRHTKHEHIDEGPDMRDSWTGLLQTPDSQVIF